MSTDTGQTSSLSHSLNIPKKKISLEISPTKKNGSSKASIPTKQQDTTSLKMVQLCGSTAYALYFVSYMLYTIRECVLSIPVIDQNNEITASVEVKGSNSTPKLIRHMIYTVSNIVQNYG